MRGAEAIGRWARDCYKALLAQGPGNHDRRPDPTGIAILLLSLEHQDLTVKGLALGFLILSLGIHEAAHAFVAWRCGDSTAKDMGRMTLDPIPHIDPVMTILLPAVLYFTSGFLFGGAKPVPVLYHRLRHPLRDMMLVALAGPASNFILAVLFLLMNKVLFYGFGMSEDQIAVRVMFEAMRWNLLLAAFNLLPVPPLDGSRVMTWILPASLREGYAGLERFGLLIVMALLFTGIIGRFVWPLMRFMADFADTLTGGSWN